MPPSASKLGQAVTRCSSARVSLPVQMPAPGWGEQELIDLSGMYLAALRCLNETAALDSDSPDLHRQIVHFHRISQSFPPPLYTCTLTHPLVSTSELSASVKTVVEKAFTLLPSSTSAADFNKTFLSSHSSSAAHILVAAQAALELQPAASARDVESILFTMLADGVNASVTTLQGALETLQRASASAEQVSAFKAKCHERLPLAWVFASDEQKAGRKLGSVDEDEAPVVNGNGPVKADV